MRRMRTRLSLAAAACFVLSLPARAQVAPTLSGETGLFEITTADSIAAGRLPLRGTSSPVLLRITSGPT